MAPQEYRVVSLLASFGISAMAQNAELYPFTHRSADRFFAFFMRETFMFDGEVNYMFIHTGKDNLPSSSYAQGWLFTETEEEVEAEWDATGHRPRPIGDIYFNCGTLLGEETKPHIKVERRDGSFKWQNYEISQRKPKAKEGCFIATAVYGSTDVRQVMTFRNFRDEFLSRCSVGQLVIKIYGWLSPSLAMRIHGRRKLRWVVRYALLNPIYYLLTAVVPECANNHDQMIDRGEVNRLNAQQRVTK